MTSVLDHALLVVSVVALGAAGLRTAAALGGAGLFRVLAAVPIAASAAAIEALGLGLVDIGSDPLALTLAACATWLLATSLLPRPAGELSVELREGWLGLSRGTRVAAAASAGMVIALTIWFLANPALVGDGLVYHLPIVVAWVNGGDPASLVSVATDAPIEAYPLTNELLLTWTTGIARSFVPVTVWTPAMLVLAALAAWSGLRRLDVPELVAVLAVAALLTSPLLVRQLNTANTDLPALAWLVCCAALCVGSLRAPGLLVAAVAAAGLAIGTKTTTLPLAVVCLVVTLIVIRGRLRPLAGALAAAIVAAALVGGLWYLRNLILHGSPLWPFASGPWGDPIPPVYERGNGRLLWDPSSAAGRFDDYARFLYGALVLLGGGLLAVLVSRSRRVLAASAATGFALLIWANAPYTAFPPDPFFDGFQAGATRYLTPAIAAGALALALAGAGRGAGGDLAKALLAGALLANLAGVATLGMVGAFDPVTVLEEDPILPSAAVPLAGAAVGALAAVALSRPRLRGLPPLAWGGAVRPIGWVVCVVLAGALLAVTASGYVERSTGLDSTPAGAAWLVRQERYVEHDDPVAIQNRTIATVAGDRLRHPVTLIPAHPGCAQLREAAGDGWIVLPVARAPVAPGTGDPDFEQRERELRAGELAAARCLADREPDYGDEEVRIYAPDRPG